MDLPKSTQGLQNPLQSVLPPERQSPLPRLVKSNGLRLTHRPGHQIFCSGRMKRRNPAVLVNWIAGHPQNPYPTKGEKESLAEHAGMTPRQLNDWFANARRNIKKVGYDKWKKKHPGNSAVFSEQDSLFLHPAINHPSTLTAVPPAANYFTTYGGISPSTGIVQQSGQPPDPVVMSGTNYYPHYHQIRSLSFPSGYQSNGTQSNGTDSTTNGVLGGHNQVLMVPTQRVMMSPNLNAHAYSTQISLNAHAAYSTQINCLNAHYPESSMPPLLGGSQDKMDFTTPHVQSSITGQAQLQNIKEETGVWSRLSRGHQEQATVMYRHPITRSMANGGEVGSFGAWENSTRDQGWEVPQEGGERVEGSGEDRSLSNNESRIVGSTMNREEDSKEVLHTCPPGPNSD